jgi:hypothetical protein
MTSLRQQFGYCFRQRSSFDAMDEDFSLNVDPSPSLPVTFPKWPLSPNP